MRCVDRFAVGAVTWIQRLGDLRNAVRQELIGRQLDAHVPAGASVVDVGCGQGTQAIRLARRGCSVIGVDPSIDLLHRCESEARSAGLNVDLRLGRLEDLDAVLGNRRFEVVCAHGLLMYLDDPAFALATLTERLEPGGILSVTFRNGAALAFRPGMRGQWQAAIAAFDASTYVNELGVDARADRLDDITAVLAARGLVTDAWYGVRVFTDPAAADEPLGDVQDFEQLIRAEQLAGSRDPYRQLASQIHLIARKRANPNG
ncbi:MAG: SAM-dependent methyltransferase [Pseudonocardiales bacterium]|nr:MAG: SAM-dependent methyltransferase [Pseudonocardiales bacterium]